MATADTHQRDREESPCDAKPKEYGLATNHVRHPAGGKLRGCKNEESHRADRCGLTDREPDRSDEVFLHVRDEGVKRHVAADGHTECEEHDAPVLQRPARQIPRDASPRPREQGAMGVHCTVDVVADALTFGAK